MIHLKRIETPLGTMVACASSQGICLLEFADKEALQKELSAIATLLNATVIHGHNSDTEHLEKELSEYFAGSRHQFTVPLHTLGTDFQKQVWAALQNIPFGQTKSYKEQAMAINKPQSIRAVANANGKNKIAIVIPCHRVIGAGGQLTGYSGGLWRKQHLMELEQNNKQ